MPSTSTSFSIKPSPFFIVRSATRASNSFVDGWFNSGNNSLITPTLDVSLRSFKRPFALLDLSVFMNSSSSTTASGFEWLRKRWAVLTLEYFVSSRHNKSCCSHSSFNTLRIISNLLRAFDLVVLHMMVFWSIWPLSHFDGNNWSYLWCVWRTFWWSLVRFRDSWGYSDLLRILGAGPIENLTSLASLWP